MKAITLTADATYSNRYGSFAHNDMVGKNWGSKCSSINQKGFIHLLYPTPELWTLVLPHRTQILYQPDISLITSFLELKPGVVMIESGTGSGSFSHSIARTIAPNGHLHSFEYHAERALKAAEEFKEHDFDSLITLTHRNVCKDGFQMKDKVTAVFLDLPSPWEALESAKEAFRKDRVGRICSFSPCIEQVQATCSKMKELGFSDIKLFEVLLRPHELRKVEIQSLPTSAPLKGTKEPKEPSMNGKRKRLELLDESIGVVTSKIAVKVRGHTSFLTFATLLPSA